MGRLTTHILDTASGVPGEAIAIRLYRLDDRRELVKSTTTDADGRTSRPLLHGSEMKSGHYEIEFDVGDYFRGRGADLDEPAFLDTVVIRFAVRDDEHYHVPLLVSPWSYSTYRGS